MNKLLRELMVVPSTKCDFKLAQMHKAAQEAELDLRGWPVLWLGDEYIQHQEDGLTCRFEGKDQIEFGWKLGRSGLLFHRQTGSESFYEDEPNNRAKGLFDPVLRILEFAEDVAVITRLYQILEAGPDITLSMCYRWKGAKDRLIAYNKNPIAISSARHGGRVVQIDAPTCRADVSVGATQESIPAVVLTLFRDLFDDLTTDLGNVADDVITDWALKCLTRTIF